MVWGCISTSGGNLVRILEHRRGPSAFDSSCSTSCRLLEILINLLKIQKISMLQDYELCLVSSVMVIIQAKEFSLA